MKNKNELGIKIAAIALLVLLAGANYAYQTKHNERPRGELRYCSLTGDKAVPTNLSANVPQEEQSRN
jgi:hypothetical protein